MKKIMKLEVKGLEDKNGKLSHAYGVHIILGKNEIEAIRRMRKVPADHHADVCISMENVWFMHEVNIPQIRDNSLKEVNG